MTFPKAVFFVAIALSALACSGAAATTGSNAPSPQSTPPAPAPKTSTCAPMLLELTEQALSEPGGSDRTESKTPTASSYEEVAICQEHAGELIEALKYSQLALEHAIAERNAPIMQTSRTRVKSLLGRVPHITFAVRGFTSDLVVEFDGRSVPVDALGKKFSVNPGPHVVAARAVRDGRQVRHMSRVDVVESQMLAIHVDLQ